ncbi:MAG: HNH endonuclease [Deltaproteobacteria bacterium]|nr:HNH endonuclease [Deltaproteobacteria bacterium]
MFDRTKDARIRGAAFDWLSEQVRIHGDVLPNGVLAQGFDLNGQLIPLVGPQGIFKPRVLADVPLTITTVPEGPYDDAFGADGLLRYRYRGTDPNHPDNRGLRLAMDRRLPLIYFHGIVRGRYLATWPVFIVEDNPEQLFFSVAVDDASHVGLPAERHDGSALVGEDTDMARRIYITATVRQRLHQRAFRERVLDAYRRQCAFCRLRHEELLDAAHIIADAEPKGEPLVPNGLSLCKLHHAAFDRHFLGLRPDYILEVRSDILREHDGPTLVHAIQALHGRSITLPRQSALQPSRELLEIRYTRFREAS